MGHAHLVPPLPQQEGVRGKHWELWVDLSPVNGPAIVISPNQLLPTRTHTRTLGTGVAELAGNGLTAAKGDTTSSRAACRAGCEGAVLLAGAVAFVSGSSRAVLAVVISLITTSMSLLAVVISLIRGPMSLLEVVITLIATSRSLLGVFITLITTSKSLLEVFITLIKGSMSLLAVVITLITTPRSLFAVVIRLVTAPLSPLAALLAPLRPPKAPKTPGKVAIEPPTSLFSPHFRGLLAPMEVKGADRPGKEVTMTMTKFKQKVKQARDGIAAVVPATTSIPVNGKTYTVQEVTKTLGDLYAVLDAVDQLRQQLQPALSAQRAALPQGHVFYVELGQALKGLLGKANPLLTELGYAPAKQQPPRTAEQKAAAAAKRKLTREARGTMGKKQKLSIVGGPVTVQLVGPDGKPIGGVIPPAGGATGK